MDLAARWADPKRDHRHRAQDLVAHDRAIPSLCGFDNRFLSWVSGFCDLVTRCGNGNGILVFLLTLLCTLFKRCGEQHTYR